MNPANKTPFSLPQKVYIVKMYYKHDSVRNVGEALQKRFSIKLKESEMRVISQIVLEFEATGSVLRQFGYEKEVAVVAAAPKLELKEELSYATEIIDDEDIIIKDDEEEMEEEEYELEIVRTRIVDESEEVSESSQCGPAERTTAPKETNVYECDICQKTYTIRKSFIRHRKSHDPNRVRIPYICEICGKVLSSQKTHKVHMAIHEEVKRYECQHCGMRFARAEGLKRHNRTHTGEKPYRCEHCGATFAAFMSHQMHVRLHTGERPFKCHHCNESFIGAPALNTHLRTHDGEYSHECYACSGRFKTEKTLMEHIQKKHAGNNLEMIEITIMEAGGDEQEEEV